MFKKIQKKLQHLLILNDLLLVLQHTFVHDHKNIRVESPQPGPSFIGLLDTDPYLRKSISNTAGNLTFPKLIQSLQVSIISILAS
jgi:hypothetical protein